MLRLIAKGREFRHKLPLFLGLLTVLVSLGIWYCLTDVPTSFAAVLTTTSIRFVSRGVGSDPDKDAGLFAPSQVVNLQVIGCGELQSVDEAPDTAGSRIPCGGRTIVLHGVQLDTLTLPAGTAVWVHLEGGRLHMQMTVPPGVQPVGTIVRSLAQGAGKTNQGALSEGEWSVTPIPGMRLELVFSAEQAGVLPEQADLPLENRKSVSFTDEAGESMLMGDHNTIRLANAKEPIALQIMGLQSRTCTRRTSVR